MALRNDQYDALMREYSRRQAAAWRTLNQRRQSLEEKYPRLRRIDEEAAACGAGQIRARLSGAQCSTVQMEATLRKLSEERKKILLDAGLPEDYLEPPYTCPLCQDTGYIGQEKCSCFKKAEISLLYSQSHLGKILEEENFRNFSLDYYSDTIINESTGLTARRTAEKACKDARQFVQNFNQDFQNLFLYGEPGVGKTFLSHCIACELLKRGFSVLYFSAQELFRVLGDQTFSRENAQGSTEDILVCDLLIIDDLGTELTNSFVSSSLFLCVNERILREKPTIISTNLKLDEFSAVYSERTFSRIAGNYQMIKLIGRDIPLQKKLNGR